MGQKVLVVRVGDKYGIEYETYLKSKIPNIEFITTEHPLLPLQWTKMTCMNMDIDEPIVVMDIDVILENNYMEMFDYPIERGQFLAMKSWWTDTSKPGYTINGGFYKYYPKDCKYIYEKMMSNPEYWQNYYIENGTTHGPVNGEQYFVEDSVKEKLELIYLPQNWYGKMKLNPPKEWLIGCNLAYPGDWFYLDGEFNEDVKLIHFQKTHSLHE